MQADVGGPQRRGSGLGESQKGVMMYFLEQSPSVSHRVFTRHLPGARHCSNGSALIVLWSSQHADHM